jgi:hypothetical protein
VTRLAPRKERGTRALARACIMSSDCCVRVKISDRDLSVWLCDLCHPTTPLNITLLCTRTCSHLPHQFPPPYPTSSDHQHPHQHQHQGFQGCSTLMSPLVSSCVLSRMQGTARCGVQSSRTACPRLPNLRQRWLGCRAKPDDEGPPHLSSLTILEKTIRRKQQELESKVPPPPQDAHGSHTHTLQHHMHDPHTQAPCARHSDTLTRAFLAHTATHGVSHSVRDTLPKHQACTTCAQMHPAYDTHTHTRTDVHGSVLTCTRTHRRKYLQLGSRTHTQSHPPPHQSAHPRTGTHTDVRTHAPLTH